MISPAPRWWLLPLCLGVACKKDSFFSGSMDTPAPLAVLPAEAGGPFTDPVGYVADAHGGRIRVLDLVRGSYLAGGPIASFVSGEGLGTGAARLLGGIAARAPADDRVDVLAIDRRYQQLIKIPHVVSVEGGIPQVAIPRVVSANFDDVDGSGDDPEIRVDPPVIGRAATETWTAVFDSGVWRVEGSRSGPQKAWAATNARYETDDASLAFTIIGTATPGDHVSIDIDSGITETPLSATPEALALSPDGSILAVTTQHDDGAGELLLLDPDSSALLWSPPLPVGSRPVRMDWTSDGSTLYAADAGRPAIWEIPLPGAGGSPVEHILPWPAFDVAVLDGDGGRRLYIARADRSEVWMMDPTTDTLIDINIATPEIDGMVMLSPVRGLTPIRSPFDYPGRDDLPGRHRGQGVAVSVQSGSVVVMAEDTGCLINDGLGPRSVRGDTTNPYIDYEPQFKIPAGESLLARTEDPNHHVVVNPCAGIAWSESWELRYDAIRQGWRVTGAVSGEQQALAYEDQRYISDRGQISFLMLAGTSPSRDGWRILFDIDDGVMSVSGNPDSRGVRTINMDLLSEPAIFDGPWGTTERPFIVVAAQAADIVVRADVQTGIIDFIWD